jgi:hypothetical protein
MYDNMLNHAGFTCLIMELADKHDPLSFTLKYHNKYMQSLNANDISQRVGDRIVDIYPNSMKHELMLPYYEVITSGKPQCIKELIYKDDKTPMLVMSVWITKISYNQVLLLVQDVTQQTLVIEDLKKNIVNLEYKARENSAIIDKNYQLQTEVNALLVELGRAQKY